MQKHYGKTPNLNSAAVVMTAAQSPGTQEHPEHPTAHFLHKDPSMLKAAINGYPCIGLARRTHLRLASTNTLS
jgi:hypothetical protein